MKKDKKKLEELKRQRDEKIRRRIERERRKHEKEMEELRIQIKQELISKGEFIDACNEIYNMNFYNQKELRGVPTILGHAGQIAINLAILRNSFIKIFTENKEEKPPDEEKPLEEEKSPENEEKDKKVEKSPEKDKKSPEKVQGDKGQQIQSPPEPEFLDFNETIKKLIDLYLLKASPFYFVFPNDILDKIKAIDESISRIDDIWKVEKEENFKNIINLLIEANSQESLDPVIGLVESVLSQDFNGADFKEIYNQIITIIFSISKASTEFDPKDKIKFIQIVTIPPEDNNYFGICDIKQTSIPKTKTSNDLAAQLLAKKNMGKKDAKGRPYFEPIFSEKVYITPLMSDKMKILAMNTNYERMFRNNLLSCLEKLESKFAAEGENLVNTMDEGYNLFVSKLKKKLEEKYSKDVLDIVVESPTDAHQETK